MTSKQTSRLGKSPEEGIKAPVVVASIANLSLTGLPIISGVQLVEGDRVLIKEQTDSTQNGIYCAAVGNWDRASDWNKSNDVVNGQLVLDANSGQLYRAAFTGDFSINVTQINFFIVQSFNSKDRSNISEMLNDATLNLDDVIHVKEDTIGSGSKVMIFDVVTIVTEDTPNGIYTGIANTNLSFVLRDTNINDPSQSYTFKTVVLMKATGIKFPEEKVIFCQGYLTESDGGSNWGIVRYGAHTEDGGRIISIDANTYVEMNMVGVINIRKWGCDPSLADNSTQWQKAVTYAELNTGGATRVPAGIFTCLSAIDIGFNGSVEGVGYSSRPTWTSVNAFNFAASGIPSGRAPFKDFWVIGNKTAGTKAFNVDTGDDGVTLTIKGLTFKNITCDGFEEGWRLTGVWNCDLRKCETVNCWHGANELGRNIHIVYHTCTFVRGATTLGSGTSTGIRQAVSGGVRAENLQIKNTLLFGFNYAVDIQNCLEFHMEGCDSDFCVETGARIVVVEGGGSIKSSWIWLVDATNVETGIDFVDLGTDVDSKFIVYDNHIQKETAGAVVGMDGVFVGVNHRGVEIDSNTIKNFHTTARITSPKVKYTNNKDLNVASASVNISEFALNCTIAGNDLASGIVRHANKPKIIFGQNEGVLTDEAFVVVLGAGLATQTYTWASLGLPDGMANGNFIVMVNSQGGTSSGWTRGAATQTQLTVYVETALGGAVGLDVMVKAF